MSEDGSAQADPKPDEGERDAAEQAGKATASDEPRPEAAADSGDGEAAPADDGPAGPNPFAEFEAQLRQVDPDLQGLEDPAPSAVVDEAEAALGVDLPASYRDFLARYNGGSAYETNLYGVGTDDDFDLARLNLRDREDGLPPHLVAFAASLAGDLYCFDTQVQDDRGESPVALLDPEDGTLMSVAPSFPAFLDRLPRLESEIAEARGPQPMTVTEWEAFLIREREKLRKLSRTPARELRMPDPEQVRADLGGKIPVDPRHLKPRE